MTDEPKSFAYGSIFDGVFDGKIHSRDGVFYVEKASKYFPGDANSTQDFHSIIYQEQNVVDPYEKHRKGTCWLHSYWSFADRRQCL